MTRLAFIFFIAMLVGCSDNSDSHRAAVVPTLEPVVEPQETPIPDLGAEVELVSGIVLGQAHAESDVWEWLAIPFAAAPVGDLRWRAPQSPESWDGVRETMVFGNPCPQMSGGALLGDEDCLQLNVWRPRTQERDLPVYVWIHGGSNVSGANNRSSYQGDRLAQSSNMVVVSIQYRLGALGWFYLDDLHSGDPLDDSGNYGTLDIIESLEWIRNNIEVFGGDPGNVIVTGESAGAMNIMTLLVSDIASGLFHKAIIQSGAPFVASIEAANTAAKNAMKKLFELVLFPSEEDRVEALRAVSAEDLLRSYDGPSWAFPDGTVIPKDGLLALESGEHVNKVPIIVGTNKDEYKFWTNPLIINAHPNVTTEVRDALGRYISDMWRVVGADKFARDITSAPDQPDVYVYRFNWGSPNEDGSPLPLDFGVTLGAHHAAEIPFVLGHWEEFVNPAGTGLFYTQENALGRENLSGVIMEYFAAFAHSGNPNGGNLATWEPVSSGSEFNAIVLDVDLVDGSAKITSDSMGWTLETVLGEVEANLVEPTKTAILIELDEFLSGEL